MSEKKDLKVAPEAKALPDEALEGVVGGVGARIKVTLMCTECKQRNYNTTKDKKAQTDRIQQKRYCRFCGKHTMHKDTK